MFMYFIYSCYQKELDENADMTIFCSCRTGEKTIKEEYEKEPEEDTRKDIFHGNTNTISLCRWWGHYSQALALLGQMWHCYSLDCQLDDVLVSREGSMYSRAPNRPSVLKGI